ncbi:MAG: FAD:protein FMN transferase [Erysipelotrichales bacterium]
MKKRYIFSLFILIILVGCSGSKAEKFSDSFLSFDTYIQLDGYTKDKEEFDKYYKGAKLEFERYHQLFDAYNNYEGVNNLKMVNDNAGKKAVKVDKELYDLVDQSIKYYNDSYKKNNIALAPVVLVYKDIMKDYDDGKKVSHPSMSLLKEKAKCTSIGNIELQGDNKIYLKESCARIDVGSVAKGYAADKVANKLNEEGLNSGILNAGGNVVVIGKKPGNKDFKIGIADPKNPNSYALTVDASDTNIVTSGDYQRFYEIDGVKYNHITDPDTLKPGNINKSVSIISDDGLLADYFSTESFMLNINQIKELSRKYKFEYIVIDKNDKLTMSEGINDAVEVK